MISETKVKKIRFGTYILHFEKELDPNDHRVKYGDQLHYVGFSSNVFFRIFKHKNFGGCLTTRYLLSKSIKFKVANIFFGENRESEFLKNKSYRDHCRYCNPNAIVQEKD